MKILFQGDSVTDAGRFTDVGTGVRDCALGAGYVKLIANRTGHIIGGSIVAKDALAMSGEISLAIRHDLNALEIASTPHIANDFSYAIQEAAKKLI